VQFNERGYWRSHTSYCHFFKAKACTRNAARPSYGTRYQRLHIWRLGNRSQDEVENLERDSDHSGKSNPSTSAYYFWTDAFHQRCANVEVSPQLIMNPDGTAIREDVLKHMDDIADRTKANIFLLHPKQLDADSASLHGNIDSGSENKLRISIYGDMECCEHAKTRLLIMIDQIVSEMSFCRLRRFC